MSKKKTVNIQAHGGRFGPGKVHYTSFSSNDAWNATACGLHVHGEKVDAKDHPVTCKRCIAQIPK